MDRKILKEYAELIVKKGIGLLPGQEVVLRTAPEQLEFIEIVTEECYLAGARKVNLEWRYDPVSCLNINYQTLDTLSEIEKWEEERLRHKAEILPAMIYLDSDDPDGLDGADQEKWALAQQARYKVTHPYRDAMENRYQWCIAGVPGLKWARKVFPGCPDEEAVEKLWYAILKCARADANPLANWEEHNRILAEKCEWLNSLNLKRLEYRSLKTGTDFSVGLMPQMRFCGGAEWCETKKVFFNANIPSEEIFTTPMKGDCEGTVFATRPLSYRGVMIEDFSIRFKNGRVCEVHAAKGEEALKRMVDMDEGASMLGECALVPYNSPIRESGILFYSTLFDENASCHLALGDGYSSCLDNPENYTLEQARELGVNHSMIHEDFMIGSDDLDIIGIDNNGNRIQIFKDGDWA